MASHGSQTPPYLDGQLHLCLCLAYAILDGAVSSLMLASHKRLEVVGLAAPVVVNGDWEMKGQGWGPVFVIAVMIII